MNCRPFRTLITLALMGPAAAFPCLHAAPAPPVLRRPAPASLAHGVPITLNTAFQDQNPLLPVVMHTLARNLNGTSGPKTEFDRAFDRAMAAHPQVSRALLRRLVAGYDALPADIRSRGIAPEFQHLDPRQPLRLDQVRSVFLQRRLIRAGSPRLVGPRAAGATAAGGAHLPLRTLLRLASAAGLDGAAVKGAPRQVMMTAGDLNALRLSRGSLVPAAGASVTRPGMQANLAAAEQYLQHANDPRLDTIVKKGPKNGLILPGSVLYLRGANLGDQAAQNQIEIFGTLAGGFVALATPAFAPDLVAAKGSQQELQVTVPAGLPPGSYTLKVVVGGVASNGLSLPVNQAPPPLPQISGSGPVTAGEVLPLSGSHLQESPGLPWVQFSLGGQPPVAVFPILAGVQAMTNTALYVPVPADLPGGDYQVTFLKGGSDNPAQDAVSNTITVHINPLPGPQLSPGPDTGGTYSVSPGDTVLLNGSSFTRLPTRGLVLTPLDGDNNTVVPTLKPQPGGTDTTLTYQIPYMCKPGNYTAQIDQTASVPLKILPYQYDFAFTEMDKTGTDGGQYFAVLSCLRDTEGFALTTGNHFFNEAQTTWALGNDGVIFQNKPVYDRAVIIAQPFWYNPSTTGSDFSADKEAVQTIATLATDVCALAGEPEIGAAVVAVAKLVEDIISLFPTTAAVGPSIGKYDDPQTTQFSYSDLQASTHEGSHTFTGQVGHVVSAIPIPANPDPSEDYTPHAWKVFFTFSRQHE